MSLKKFEAAEAAWRLGSLKKVAAELGYTQSGVSHMISGLEQELGVPLLVRSKGGVTLTQAGERLMPLVTDMLKRYREILQSASFVYFPISSPLSFRSNHEYRFLYTVFVKYYQLLRF